MSDVAFGSLEDFRWDIKFHTINNLVTIWTSITRSSDRDYRQMTLCLNMYPHCDDLRLVTLQDVGHYIHRIYFIRCTVYVSTYSLLLTPPPHIGYIVVTYIRKFKYNTLHSAYFNTDRKFIIVSNKYSKIHKITYFGYIFCK